METETILIPIERLHLLEKKERLADDLLIQLESSLKDLELGRIRRVR